MRSPPSKLEGGRKTAYGRVALPLLFMIRLLDRLNCHHFRHHFLVAALSIGGAAVAYATIDTPVARLVEPLQDTFTHGVLNKLSQTGKSEWYLALAVVLGLAAPYWRPAVARRAWCLFVGVATTGLVVLGIKHLTGRARPKTWFTEGAEGFHWLETESAFHSFPSGHAATLMAAAVGLGYCFPKYRAPLLVGAFLLTLLRVVVGMHYVSDVLVGAWVGFAGASAWVAVWQRRARTSDELDSESVAAS